MNAQTDSGLPACEFNIPHLTPMVDELIPSEVDRRLIGLSIAAGPLPAV